jgi:hypothetical protein
LFEPLCATLSEELSLEDVKALAARFRTTLTATAVRLVQAVPHGFVAFSTAEGVGWWKRFDGRGGSRLWLQRKQPVDPRSRPGRCHQGESDTERVEVPLDSWLNGVVMGANGSKGSAPPGPCWHGSVLPCCHPMGIRSRRERNLARENVHSLPEADRDARAHR